VEAGKPYKTNGFIRFSIVEAGKPYKTNGFIRFYIVEAVVCKYRICQPLVVHVVLGLRGAAWMEYSVYLYYQYWAYFVSPDSWESLSKSISIFLRFLGFL